ncbi:MAG: hypothetical protein QOH68_2939 [Nocardioidaceae bacterium]|jgi:DNA-binding CsgD family transcriptional regulator/tetratricopeptide (TPR) repeat protein|nr:hypothetical protein [Nocardioidaceae bacterium]
MSNGIDGALSRAPVVERQEILEQLVGIAGEAARGHGGLVLLSGEAGVGKTTLVEGFLDAVGDRLIVRRGGCDNVTTPAPLGPFLEAVPELADVSVPANGEDSSALFRTAAGVMSSAPSVVVLEDLHWADGASLDLLRHLGRRVSRMPLMLVVTFRSDELDDAHPLRVMLGDLATAPGVSRVAVPALTLAGVEQLAVAVGSGIDVAGLHARTGGNAFHVTEVLAAGGDDVPITVRDAVLARTSRLSDGARRTLDAAAILGPGADVAVLTAVADRPLSDVDECVARGILRADRDTVTFRHELARLAVEETLTFESRRQLHARALAELTQRGCTDDRRLAHHAQEADDRGALLDHAMRAADLAAARGAHREAAEHQTTVLGILSADSPERPKVLDSLGNALCLLGRADEALVFEHEALELHRSAQNPRGAGRSMRRISRLSWMLGRGAVADQFARRAIEVLEPEGPAHELAMAYSNLAQIHMLSDDAHGAAQWGERALAMASDLGDEFVRAHALNNVGSSIATADDLEGGAAMLGESLRIALDHGFVDHAARAYCNLSVSLSLHRRFEEAESVMAQGIAYSADRDLDYYGDYITAMLAKSAAERGDLDEAQRLVEHVLAIPHLAVVGRIPALATRGELEALRNGGGEELIAEAMRLAEQTREPQRLAPVAMAQAELAWIQGRRDDAVETLDQLWEANAKHPHPWRTGELAWWLLVVDEQRELPVVAAGPFALMLDGRMSEAAELWRSLGSPLWAARSLAASSKIEDVRHGLAELEAIGALGLRDAILRDRQRHGLPAVRGPRAMTAAHPAGLTAREVEVLTLLGKGLTNAEIGASLYVSPKTAGHHVSAVLRKLDAPNRARAAAIALERGLIGE